MTYFLLLKTHTSLYFNSEISLDVKHFVALICGSSFFFPSYWIFCSLLFIVYYTISRKLCSTEFNHNGAYFKFFFLLFLYLVFSVKDQDLVDLLIWKGQDLEGYILLILVKVKTQAWTRGTCRGGRGVVTCPFSMLVFKEKKGGGVLYT